MAAESRSLGGVSAMLSVMIISSAVMVRPGLGHGDDKPSADETYVDNLPQKVVDYIKNCTSHISSDCSKEIVRSIIKKTSNVSTICCHDLVQMGFECHNALVKVFAGLPDEKQDVAQAMENGRKVFDRCVAADKNHDHPDPPTLP